MALTAFALELLAPALRGAHVLCLGYPDILCTPDRVQKILGAKPTNKILGAKPTNTTPYGADHKSKHLLPDTEEVLQLAGVASVLYVDMFPSRGCEFVADLNEPQNFGRKFDVVIDPGTIEHCANIGGALMNAANAVVPGGVVYHSPPMTAINHGFYNVCPTLLHDFYSQNGWEVKHLSGFEMRMHWGYSVDAHARQHAPHNLALHFVAKRLRDGGLKWPTQQRYLKRK